MKRILQLSYSLALAGTETVIMNWYRNIDTNRVQFDFLSAKDGEDNLYFKKEIEKLGGKVFIIKRNSGIIEKIKFYFNLFKLIKNNNFYAFHTHAHYSSGFDCMIASIAGVKKRFVISHFNAGWGPLKRTPFYKKFFSRLLIQIFSTNCLAVSYDAGKNLYGRHIQFQVLPNGIDTEKFNFNEETRNKIRKDLKIENRLVIGNVGRFETQKNHSFLIEIFNEIYKLNNNSVLLLVGDGSLKNKIEKKIKSLNLQDNTIVLKARKDIEKIYQAMDSFIFPSLFEGLGNVVIEAQCSGLPCFISDGVPEEAIICNTTKISLKKSAEEWAEIILEKMKKFKRKESLKFIKDAGFDIKYTAKQIEKLYLEE